MAKASLKLFIGPGRTSDDVEKAREIFDASRVRLEAAMTVAGLPKFTVSFGVVAADPKDDLPSTISRADAALFQAKREGRDRVVVFDVLGHEVPAPGALPLAATNGNGNGNGNGRVLNGRETLEVAEAVHS